MEEHSNIKTELRKLDDMLCNIEQKIYNLTGLLELVYLGMKGLTNQDCSYELSSLYAVKDYLEAIDKTDIPKMRDKLDSIREYI